MTAMIAADLFIANEPVTKVGYLVSEYISPMVTNDSQNPLADTAPGSLTLPCEVFMSNDNAYTFILLRSGICQGKMFPFGAVFTEFVEQNGFKNLVLLSSTLSPVKRERESNREIPEVFAYVNNHLHKKCIEGGTNYYEKYGIRKFGYWLGEHKKKAHQELEEMLFAGSSQKLVKAFNKTDVPTQLFLVFTTGGIDFVGGYTYYQFLKNNLKEGTGEEGQALGKVAVAKTGEEIHQMIFVDKCVKAPAHWKQIVAYF